MTDERPPIDPRASRSSREVWWTAKRMRLYRWFQEGAGHLAPIYCAAVRMTMEESFPGRVHLVAHAMREIRNRLPDAVAGVVKPGRNYHDLATKVRSRWETEDFPSDGPLSFSTTLEPSTSGPEKYEVSVELLRVIADLVDANARATGNSRRQAGRLFEAIWGEPPPAYVVDNWFRTEDWIRKHMHLDNKTHGPEADTEVAAIFGAFEKALLAISNRSYENLEELDEILASANR